jgi:site-specific DNA recombinase
VPLKASQGRTKTRLKLDPDRAPVEEQMFIWRAVDKLGQPAIAAKLNAAGIPAPSGAPGWTAQTVAAILANPKYTEHMVYGRRRTRNGRRRRVPPAQWFSSPSPCTPRS